LKIWVLAPAYNEEQHIHQFIEETGAVMDGLGLDYEIVVIDDGSTDRTAEIARHLSSNPRLKIVSYTRNMGKGYAIKRAFARAIGDLVLLIDTDMEISPQQIVSYIGAIELGDIVLASRWHPKSRTEMPLIRKLLSHGFNVVVTLLTGLRVKDTQSGMKAFRRDVLESVLPKLAVKRYAFDVELLAVANLKGFSIVEYPVSIKIGGPITLGPLVRMVWAMFIEMLGITYRLRVLRYYNEQ
jgi:glycosyltransferase involved in cell wall biosynthesis